jgi:periplasmic protein TonB
MSAVASSAAAGERLALAIFLAAAVHGILILGLSFTPPDAPGDGDVPTLEVTLLDAPVPDQEAPEDAQYLAQASQAGAGNVDQVVPAEFFAAPPAPEDPQPAPPEPDEPAAERVSSWNSALLVAIAPSRPDREARPEPPPDGGETRVTAVGERAYFVSVSAREVVFAEYLASWKARMERIGTLNYPAVTRERRKGNPVLEVEVAADGNLRAVRVTQSSGSPALDQAAIGLVRLGSPFDPFPAAVRARYDVLTFAYEWRFIEGQAGAGELRAAPR